MVTFLRVLVYSFFPIRTACPIQVPQLTVVAVFAKYCFAKKPCILPIQCNCVLSCHSPNLLPDQLHSFCRSWRLNLLLSPLRQRRCHGAVHPPESQAVSVSQEIPACGSCSKAHESIPHPSLNLPIVTPIFILSPHLRSNCELCPRIRESTIFFVIQ